MQDGHGLLLFLSAFICGSPPQRPGRALAKTPRTPRRRAPDGVRLCDLCGLARGRLLDGRPREAKLNHQSPIIHHQFQSPWAFTASDPWPVGWVLNPRVPSGCSITHGPARRECEMCRSDPLFPATPCQLLRRQEEIRLSPWGNMPDIPFDTKLSAASEALRHDSSDQAANTIMSGRGSDIDRKSVV